ncbi:MAG: C45 family autoproteolytic acyltransferase/hydrolase [Planctomycetota bacterium]|jgi:hypothetical protein
MRSATCLAILAIFALFAPSVTAEEIASTDHGKLLRIEGVRVLKVWGTPRERGFAHGVLLGREMMALVNSLLMGPRVPLYKKREPMIPMMFRWPSHILQELEGLLEGLAESVPEPDRVIQALNRPVTLNDLMALNCLGDWLSLACSTCTVWGASTEGGRTLVGRNFDYILPTQALKTQLILAQAPGKDRKAFLTLSFPGNLGAITFLNAEGVFGAVHDVHVKPKTLAPGYTPRLVTLRLIAEGTAPENAVEKALALCRKHRSLYGNNFHIAVPNLEKVTHVAGVIEYDSDRTRDDGAVLRLPSGETLPRLWNTNHYRTRAPPKTCRRFQALDTAFRNLTAGDRKLDGALMKKLIQSASVAITMHVVVADLHAKMISAAKEDFHTVPWKAVFPEEGEREGKGDAGKDSEF